MKLSIGVMTAGWLLAFAVACDAEKPAAEVVDDTATVEDAAGGDVAEDTETVDTAEDTETVDTAEDTETVDTAENTETVDTAEDTAPATCPGGSSPCEGSCAALDPLGSCETLECVDGCCVLSAAPNGTACESFCFVEVHECVEGACEWVATWGEDDNPCTTTHINMCSVPASNLASPGAECQGGTCSAAAECLPGPSACADGEGEYFLGSSVRGCDVAWDPLDVPALADACGEGWHLCTGTEACAGMETLLATPAGPYLVAGHASSGDCAVLGDGSSPLVFAFEGSGPQLCGCTLYELPPDGTPAGVLCCAD